MNEINNFLENFNDINTEKTFVPAEIEKNKVFPILAYLIPILFFLLGVLIARLIYPLLVLAIDAMFVYGSIKGKAYRLPLIGSLIKLF